MHRGPRIGTGPQTGVRSVAKPRLKWLRDYLRASFYLGKVSTGDRLPSHRELARQLGISSTTALELYQTLESEGLLSSRQRSGTFLKQVGVEAERDTRDEALFRLMTHTVEHLEALDIPLPRYLDLLRRCTGAAPRPDFKFGFLMHREAFELASATIERICRTPLPLIRLAPERDDANWARVVVARDPSIRCIVATYLHIELATDVARAFDRHVLLARPDQRSTSVFDVPPRDTRYLVTRDRETAADLRSLIDRIFEPTKANQFVVSALEDREAIARVAATAEVVLVTPMAYAAAQAVFDGRIRLEWMPSNVSSDTIDAMLFHYLFAPPALSPRAATWKAW